MGYVIAAERKFIGEGKHIVDAVFSRAGIVTIFIRRNDFLWTANFLLF